jgi:hypothetical protein
MTAEWVNSLAQDTLADRARRVREVESTSTFPRSVAVAPAARAIQELPTAAPGRSIADVVLRRLTGYLGPHTAKVALKTFAQKATGRGPEMLTLADMPALQAALRPMLRTFIGRIECERVLDEIAREAGRS